MIVEAAADLDRDAVLRVAAGEPVGLGRGLLARVGARRSEALAVLADGPDVYGVTTGMGALSGTRLTAEEQAGHSARLMSARAVGGPPWLSREEARALVAVRLRTFLGGDAAVSAELCVWLATLLERDLVPAVPRTGSGAAGEILPLAHAWAHLAGGGELLDPEGAAVPAPPVVGPLAPPRLGPKEGIALLAGVPVATALAVVRSAGLRRLAHQAAVVAAAEIALVAATRDPYAAGVARGDDELAAVLTTVRDLAGPEPAPRHLQAPVSFRVVGPVLAHLARATSALQAAADRGLAGVTDSPAFLDPEPGAAAAPGVEAGPRFVGTAGFHGLDLAAAFEGARGALVHAASVGAARLHRLLDPGVSGLPAQLSADPGPQAGLTPVHKRVVAEVHAAAAATAAYAPTVETSQGQEDVQTFALEAAESLHAAERAFETALAAEVLAVHQALGLVAERRLPERLAPLWAEVAAVLPPGTEDRSWGPDLECLRRLIRSGWAAPSSP